MSQSLQNCDIKQMCTELLKIKLEMYCHFHQILLPAVFNKTQGEEKRVSHILGVRSDVKLRGLLWSCK